MAKHSHILFDALRASYRGNGLAAAADLDAYEVECIIVSGLGPLIGHLLNLGGASISGVAQPLRGALLTSKVMTGEMRDGVSYALAALEANDIRATLLKGISFAWRYYPEPHLRVMGDVDLLLPASQVDAGVATLRDAGFVTPLPPESIDFDKHIHAAGLFHPERELWIELHRSLILENFAASAEAPINLADLDQHQRDGGFGEQPVKRLSPEFELAYLAVGWCRDLTVACYDPGLRRMLFDAAMLLRTADTLDWERIIGWSQDTQVGACLYVMLSTLEKHGAFDDPAQALPALRKAQGSVSGVSLTIMQRIFDRHLLGMSRFGAMRSGNNASNILHALIAPRRPWQNLLAVPGSLLFPPHEARRFSPHYQLGRLASLFGKRNT